MKTKSLNKKIILITLCILSLFVFCVLMGLYLFSNLSEYVPMSPGITNLMYLPMFLWGSVSSFVLSVIFLALILIQIKTDINIKIFVAVVVVILVVFCSFNVSNIIKNIKSFDEETYFSAMNDMDIMSSPNEKIAKFFPYYSKMEKNAKQTPYYAFSTYKLNETIYRVYQIECNDYENNCSFTAEYLSTDKQYLLNKFNSEKSIYYSIDENGEQLNSSLIKHESYNGIEYDIIEQSTEKMILFSNENYYFLFHYQDSMNILDLSTQTFKELAFEQFESLKQQ